MEFGEEINAKVLPIPSEQRADVFVATPDEEMEKVWTRQGGTSTYHYPEAIPKRAPASFCGVAIFKLFLAPHISRAHFNLLLPFFERAGSEANVFEFDTIRCMFTRRDRAWCEDRVVDVITGCGDISPLKLRAAGWHNMVGGPTGPT